MNHRPNAFWLLLLLLALWSAVYAQTAAGTTITNEATATYTDSAGISKSVTSLPVTTTVLPVFGFEIGEDGTLAAPGQSATAAAGEEVVFEYTIANIGNANDTINLTTGQDAGDDGNLESPTFYADTDGSGDYTPGVDQPITSVNLDAGDDQLIFLVGTVPDTVADGDVINVQAIGTSEGDPTYDELEEDGPNWAQVSSLTLSELTLAKTASVTNVDPGGTITYDLAGQNDGGSSPFALPNVATVNSNLVSGILISDDFDDDLAYVPGTLTGSYTSAGATATSTVLYSTDNGTTWVTAEPATGVNAVGFLIQFPAGTRLNAIDVPALTYDLSFDVTVPTTAQEGDAYNNAGVLTVDNNGDGDAGDPNETVTTPPTTTEVDQTPGVNIGNSDGDDATAPDDITQDFATTPGTPVNIPLELTNGGNGPDTFNLTVPNLPAGWTAQFFPDADCDGAPDGTTPVADSGELTAGENVCIVLTVTPPAGTPPGGTPLDITATSQADPTVTDSITNTVTVSLDEGFDFTADTPESATPGSEVIYTHTATNSSNTAAEIGLALTEPSTTGWTYEYGLDRNGDGDTDDAGDIPFGPLSGVDGFALEPGEAADVLVRVSVPDTAERGDVDSYTLTATPTYDVGGTPTVGEPVSVTGTTTIIAGTIDVTKTVSVNGAPATAAPTEALPGDTLAYTIVATNTGDAPVTSVIVSDALPANTDFASVAATPSGGLIGNVLYATSATGPWAATLPSLATGQTAYVGVDTNSDGTITEADEFAAGGVLTITFTVTIQ